MWPEHDAGDQRFGLLWAPGLSKLVFVGRGNPDFWTRKLLVDGGHCIDVFFCFFMCFSFFGRV